MFFLIEYNRQKGCVVSFQKFEDSERQEAQDARLGLELALNRKGVNNEVVLLEATSEEALKKTHRRYFESLGEMRESFSAQIK